MAEAPAASAVAALPGDNSKALHEAIEKEELEKFLDLLHQPGIDLNYKQGGETPLTASIKNGNSRMAKHLIETGCDVNLGNGDGKRPLYTALVDAERVDVTLVQMLLHNGAELNAPFSLFTQTPLLYAICQYYRPSKNLEVTSMLLYYGADVNITNNYNRTPFQYAVYMRRNSCAEVLLNYYDDFSNRSMAGSTVLHDAIEMESPLVPVLLERGADVNSLSEQGSCLLEETEYHTTAKMFKYIWSKINHQLLMKTDMPFLLSYIREWMFANCAYLECLDLILESPIAHYLIEHCIDYIADNRRYYFFSIVGELLSTFEDREILPKDRLSAIYTCLSFGIKIETADLLFAINNYGCNEEFRALLYAGDFKCCDCIKQIKYFRQWKEDFYLKGFSSFSFENKQHAEAVNELLATSSQWTSKRMLEALSKVPKFPSLLELSRNGAQKFIEQEFPVTKLYQFYDVVSCLELPQSMKDVILLEKPIYDDLTIIQ